MIVSFFGGWNFLQFPWLALGAMQPTTWTLFFTGLIASVGLATALTLAIHDNLSPRHLDGEAATAATVGKLIMLRGPASSASSLDVSDNRAQPSRRRVCGTLARE
jgi:hypothetical protein